MYYVNRGYVHQSKLIESMFDNSESLIEASDNIGRLGYAWAIDSEDTFIFMPYDDEVHENWQSNEFIYIEQKLKSELRGIDAEIRKKRENTTVSLFE